MSRDRISEAIAQQEEKLRREEQRLLALRDLEKQKRDLEKRMEELLSDNQPVLPANGANTPKPHALKGRSSPLKGRKRELVLQGKHEIVLLEIMSKFPLPVRMHSIHGSLVNTRQTEGLQGLTLAQQIRRVGKRMWGLQQKKYVASRNVNGITSDYEWAITPLGLQALEARRKREMDDE